MLTERERAVANCVLAKAEYEIRDEAKRNPTNVGYPAQIKYAREIRAIRRKLKEGRG